MRQIIPGSPCCSEHLRQRAVKHARHGLAPVLFSQDPYLQALSEGLFACREKTYDGLYRITRAWKEKGKDGFLICRHASGHLGFLPSADID